MKSFFCLVLAIFALTCPLESSFAQGNPSVKIENQIDEFADVSSASDEKFASDLKNDPELKYNLWLAEFKKDSWEWHLFSTKLIFAVVIIVVLFGLVVSWHQFKSDIRPIDNNHANNNQNSDYDLSASMQSVSIKSKTIGALILVFSGVFFFLYISIVYPMNDLDRVQSTPKTAPVVAN